MNRPDAETCTSDERSAFTLVEILAVIALISILLALTIPNIGNMADSSRRTKSLSDLAALFEGARQHAVAKNTYVWVAFSDDAEGERPLYGCLIASADGLAQGFGPDDTWSAQTIALAGNSRFTRLGRAVSLGKCQLKFPNHSLANTAKFTLPSSTSDTIQFTRSVQFSPRGEARIAGGIQGTIALEIGASEGSMVGQTDQFTLSGPTGFLRFTSGDQ